MTEEWKALRIKQKTIERLNRLKLTIVSKNQKNLKRVPQNNDEYLNLILDAYEGA